MRILVVDDDPAVRRSIDRALRLEGYDVVGVPSGGEALETLAQAPPDALILDLGLPDIDGQEVLQKARQFYEGPIIILSARDREIEKIEALDAGADDYVEKPFRVGELLARLRVIMRRQSRQADAPPPIIHAGDLTIDVPRRLVTRAGEPVHLSPKEYELLVKLAEADGKVLSHKELLVSLWGPAHADDMQYLRVFIGQLRQKIEVDPSAPRLIRTQPGIGYRFMADEAARPSGG